MWIIYWELQTVKESLANKEDRTSYKIFQINKIVKWIRRAAVMKAVAFSFAKICGRN